MFDRVLVCCPTSSAKNYCAQQWIDNVMKFTYPNFEVRMFDNTPDEGANIYKFNYDNKSYGYKFHVYSSFALNKIKNPKFLHSAEKMAISHNDCARYAINNGFKYILHLESDVFPPKDVIERLMFHRKYITSAVYYIDEGKYRKPMLQKSIDITSTHTISINYRKNEEILYLDGSLQKVAHAGLGCVLIDTKVLKSIRFRHDKSRSVHPDTIFYEDCRRKKINVNVDTSIICRHENKSWGIHGISYL